MLTARRILSLGYLMLMATGLYVSAQQASANRLVHVLVTIPGNGKLLTGLTRDNFEIVENGNARPVTSFNASSPVSIAIVGVAPAEIARLKGPEDELIQLRSVPDAIRELAASKNTRKVLILTVAAEAPEVPEGTRVLRAADAETLTKAMIEIHNEYLLGFSSSDPSSVVEVTLRQVSGLPPLKIAKK